MLCRWSKHIDFLAYSQSFSQCPLLLTIYFLPFYIVAINSRLLRCPYIFLPLIFFITSFNSYAYSLSCPCLIIYTQLHSVMSCPQLWIQKKKNNTGVFSDVISFLIFLRSSDVIFFVFSSFEFKPTTWITQTRLILFNSPVSVSLLLEWM